LGDELEVRLYARLIALVACVAGIALPGCTGSQPIALPAAIRAMHDDRRIVVRPGQSIQAAVDRAIPGETIVVEPGTYREAGRACPFDTNQTCAVSVTKAAIALEGLGGKTPVVLEGSGGITNGIAVGGSNACGAHRLEGSRVTGFTVRGFSGSGISLRCVDDWELAYDAALGDGLYGFETSFSSDGRLHDDVAAGAARAGIHVGLSHGVRVDHDVAHDNVMGFEVREMLRATVDHNTAFANTAGIFELIMPGDRLERSIGNAVGDNVVQRNDRPNKCAKPSDPVCLIAPGVGIAIAGGTHNVNFGNRVIGNATFGIAVIDVCTAFDISKSRCEKLKFDPLPHDTRTERNVALQNGVDLLWTGNGSGNCWSKNRSKTRMPDKLPRCRPLR
jgi:nitrous oxidase accessory protein NosD